VFRKSHPIHLGHQEIQNDQGKWIAGPARLFDFLQGCFPVIDGNGLHVPVRQHIPKDLAIGGIIVHDQNREVLEVNRIQGDHLVR